MVMLTREKRQLCDIQGRLFELAWQNGYDSVAFMQAFMNSKAAASLDDVYDRLQWAGEGYVLGGLHISLLAFLYAGIQQRNLCGSGCGYDE